MPRISAKGQVTLPPRIRAALGVGPGDEVVVELDRGRAVVRPARRIEAAAGLLPIAPAPDDGPLARLLIGGDAGEAARLDAARRGGRRLRMSDAALLELASRALAEGQALPVAAILRDALSDRALRFEAPTALHAALDALADGGDPDEAYFAARS